MKVRSLQFGKAMSAALFVLLLIAVGSKNALAQTQVATLKHGNQISAFYGATALSDAHEAAEAGDVITLSGGVYVIETITKALTIRGTGFVTDEITGTAPTMITSDVVATVPNSEGSLSVEGVLFSSTFTANCLSSPHFINCYFGSFVTGENTVMMSQPEFFNCRFNTINISQATNSNFHNCILWHVENYGPGEGMVAYNSYIYNHRIGSTSSSNGTNAMSIFNCIIHGNWLSSNSIAVNCIGLGGGQYPFGDAMQENCWQYDSHSIVFETFDGSSYNPLTESLVLKEEIASTHLGTDGTEVGIYGGTTIPGANRPNYLRIKHCTVGDRTTDDGHLSVDIEVVTEE